MNVENLVGKKLDKIAGYNNGQVIEYVLSGNVPNSYKGMDTVEFEIKSHDMESSSMVTLCACSDESALLDYARMKCNSVVFIEYLVRDEKLDIVRIYKLNGINLNDNYKIEKRGNVYTMRMNVRRFVECYDTKIEYV